ncbi:MAG: formylglycine-generating enzyme family protein [Verrucomicrobiota bacterium]
MKNRDLLAPAALAILLAGSFCAPLSAQSPGFVYETERELVSTGDFDGDSREDVIIVDKDSGKYRLGYQQATGLINWINFRRAGMKYVSALSAGKLLASDRDAIAFASADANQLAVWDAKSQAAPGASLPVPFGALGPNGVVAVDIGGDGNTPLQDLYVSSTYNSDPNPNRISLVRSTGTQFNRLSEVPLSGALSHANRITLNGGTWLVGGIVGGDDSDSFHADDLSSGKPVAVLNASGIASGSDYAVGTFRGLPLREFVFYKAGEKTIQYRPVTETGPGKFELAAAKSFELDKPIRQAVTVSQGKTSKLLFIFGEGDSAALYDFDGTKAPVMSQVVTNRPNDTFFGAVSLGNGFVVFSTPAKGRYSTQYHIYQMEGGKFSARAYGSLPSLDDTDEITVPEVHKKILANSPKTAEQEMKAYTNTIPGTSVTYVMLPIPSGEFVMGSPETEKGRKADEGPQHKVKIAPFWMAKFEITWNEYELFMYPEDEKKLAKATTGSPYVESVADAVTRPSKPYVEMSFGMGKYGYPAISMTQHAANKYCHWLSAKTGHFYRLPTEAEWEYACRAGTTTPYFFGDNPDDLDDYAWSAKNSDFKYQKVGKKKPNPWGLCDMYGNVVEWCLDQYDPEYYKLFVTAVADNPWNKATKPYPHVVRGGSWDDDDPALLRSAARRGSDRSWKAQDPQLPKSIWYHSDAQFVGFRLVRPLNVPSAEELGKYWTSGVERD